MDETRWFEDVYARHAPALLALGRCLLPGDADAARDAAQDVFLLAWDKRAALMRHPNVGGWLVLTMKNRARSLAARERRRSAHAAFSLDEEPDRELPGEAADPEQRLLLAAQMDALRDVLGEEGARLFLAYALEGRTARELSARTGRGEDAVYKRLQRMRQALRRRRDLFGVALALLALRGQ